MFTVKSVSQSGVPGSEIHHLETAVSGLAGKVDWWNAAIIVMMVVAAAAALGLVVTQRIAFRRASQLSDAQEALATAKEQNFQLSLSGANERAQLAQQTAEAERLERVRLEAEIQPRRLSHEQQVQISRDLRHFAGMTVALATYSQDTEAMVFAIQIQEALKMGDLTVADLIGRFHASGTPFFFWA